MNSIVVFFIPAEKHINGGILSIFSLAKESRRFVDLHKSEVLISVPPESTSYKKNDLFDNDEVIYDFITIIKAYPKPDSLILHVPEHWVPEIRQSLAQYAEYLSAIPFLQINILNQNIELMPDVIEVLGLMSYTRHVTQTTAHIKYTTQEMSDKFGIPTHLFGVRLDPLQYKRHGYGYKQKIIAVSSDTHPLKEKIIAEIAYGFPDYKIIEVKNMTYGNYKELAAKCKFMVTFGEGFDSYLIEPVFSGGITFAVYNEYFFPSATYKKLFNIYESYETMLSKIVDNMKSLDEPTEYLALNKKNHAELSKIYNYDHYIKNIENFYAQKYSFYPSNGRTFSILLDTTVAKISIIEQQQLQIQDQASKLEQQQLQIQDQASKLEQQQLQIQDQASKINLQNLELKKKELLLHALTSSLSWRLTEPLRKINKLSKKL